MSNQEATQKLQHAADYIFLTRVIQGSGKTMRGTAEAWQAMSTLHGCRNAIQLEHAVKQPGSRFEMSAFLAERPKMVHRAVLVQIPMMARSAS